MFKLKKLAFIAVAGLLAASCGSDSDDPSTTESPAATVAPTSSASAASTAPDSTVAPPAPVLEPKGTLRYGTSIASQWDPHGEPRAFGMAYYMAVYDGLVNELPDNSLVPGLATEWTVSATEMRFTLRDGVVFHDGTPFDAAAVVYSLEKAKATPGAVGLGLANVESIEALSPLEVVLRLSAPDADLLNTLARQAGMMLSPNVSAEDVAAGVPAGTGPYRIGSVSQDRHVLVVNPDYWDPSQQGFESIEYLVLTDDEARLNALFTGEIDLAYVRGQQAERVRGEGFEVVDAIANVATFLILDTVGEKVPELADPRVRQAIAHAINRDAFGQITQAGVGQATDQYFLPDSRWHLSDDSSFAYPYDPDKARALLAEAGVENLEFDTVSWGPFNQGSQVLQAMLAEVGVTMNIITVGNGEDVKEMRAKKADVLYNLMPEVHPEAIWGRHVAKTATYNPFGASIAGLDEARSKAATATSDDAATAAYHDMLELAYQDASLNPLWVILGQTGYKPGTLTGVQGWNTVILGVNLRGMRFAD